MRNWRKPLYLSPLLIIKKKIYVKYRLLLFTYLNPLWRFDQNGWSSFALKYRRCAGYNFTLAHVNRKYHISANNEWDLKKKNKKTCVDYPLIRFKCTTSSLPVSLVFVWSFRERISIKTIFNIFNKKKKMRTKQYIPYKLYIWRVRTVHSRTVGLRVLWNIRYERNIFYRLFR